MSYCDIFTDYCFAIRNNVDYDIVLDTAASFYDNFAIVSAEHGPKPDAHIIFNNYVTDQGSIRCNEAVITYLRGFAVKCDDHLNPLFLSLLLSGCCFTLLPLAALFLFKTPRLRYYYK